MDTGGVALAIIALIIGVAAWGTGVGVAAGLVVFAWYYANARASGRP